MSTNSSPEDTLPQNIRDEVFKEIKSVNKNNMCIDCEKKNPKWASIHLGVQLCIDCAGKHRQYGVMYSFIKSTNLDKWNRKQLLYMQKGGNQRALEYLRKCGAISDNQKHIDYKSPILQKYKAILTAEVECELTGKPMSIAPKLVTKKMDMFEEEEAAEQKLKVPQEIPNAEEVQESQKGKKKKGKKKMGNKINLQDFDTMVFDDGVPAEEKQKIVKAYENSAKAAEEAHKSQNTTSYTPDQGSYDQPIPKPQVEKARELTEEESKQKLEELKTKKNVNSISSESFKDNSLDQQTVKSNLNKFSSSQSISSNAFFGQEESMEEGTAVKIKDYVVDAGGKLYGKLASYWGKS